jgi:hypothetical protein
MVPRNKIERTFIRRYVPDDEKVNNGSGLASRPSRKALKRWGISTDGML